MDLSAILFSGTEQFKKKNINTLSPDGLVKIAQTISENKTFRNNTILNMYIANGARADNLRGTICV